MAGVGRFLLRIYGFVRRDIRKRPLVNFYLALFVFVFVIFLSSRFQAVSPERQVKAPLKEVSLYSIGSVPKIKVEAQVEKSGVVTVVALSGGVVQKINYKEGDKIAGGSALVSLSSNYQGGNAASVQRDLANNQYQAAVDTFGLQENIIQDQRDVATTSAESAEKMRDVIGASKDKTNELVDLNKSLLESLNIRLKDLQNGAAPNLSEGADTALAIASIQGQKAQLLAGLAQAEGSLASIDYQMNKDKPPADLARFQEDLALKQLDLQEKMLGVNKEAARLQLQLATIAEAEMSPSSPISGVVQRVFVREGSVVTPGEKLAVVGRGDKSGGDVIAVAYVPGEIARRVSRVEMSVLVSGDRRVAALPYFVTHEAVSQGNSYAVYYAIPDDLAGELTDRGYIDVEIPVGYADTSGVVVYVPVDAVFQTGTEDYLFVERQGLAKVRKVDLGSVYGAYVEVKKGLRDGDQVIVSRNVVDGDRVEVR
jgi:multidrug efflux pump subunit AcrA (membrane-fusion protein)